MSTQRELEVQMIGVLYARTHAGHNPVSRAALLKIVQDQWKVSDFRFSDAFENLNRWKYLKNEAAEGDEAVYRLASHGVDWFEGWYHLQWNSKTNFTIFQQHDGPVFVDELRSHYERRLKREKAEQRATDPGPINWTKWGAIGALVALPLMALTWWYS